MLPVFHLSELLMHAGGRFAGGLALKVVNGLWNRLKNRGAKAVPADSELKEPLSILEEGLLEYLAALRSERRD
jgi:hypothetical protein